MAATSPTSDARARLLRFLTVLLALTSAFFVLIFLYCASRRLHYPFELDRMESGMLTQVWRIRNGLPLYTSPSLSYVPFLYAPLYFYLSAFLARFIGVTYAATRLVSILATLGTFAVLYAFVLREARESDRTPKLQRHLAALACIGLFASLYSYVYGWYDVGRVDSLSVFLFLCALYATRFSHPVLAAIFWVLAIQTKQSFLPIAPFLFLVDWQRPRRLFAGLGTFLVLLIGSVAWLNHITDGWYNFYVFGTTAQLHFNFSMAVLYIPLDLLGPLGIAVLIAITGAVVSPPRLRNRTTQFYAITTIFVLAAIGYVRSHEGANVNSLIPSYALLCILFGIGLDRSLSRLNNLSQRSTNPDGSHISPTQANQNRQLAFAGTALLLAASTIQIAGHIYNLGRHVPSRGTLLYRHAFLDQLRNAPGEVWVVNHSYDAILANKAPHAELDAIDAVLARQGDEKNHAVVEELRSAYQNSRFSAVILDRPAETYEKEAGFSSEIFHQNYGLEVLAAGSDQPNVADQPQSIYIPCTNLGIDLPADPWHLETSFVNKERCKASQ